MYRTVVADVQVWSRPSRESDRLRTEDYDRLLYVDEIYEDPLTCAEPSLWGRLCVGGWIVILNQAADGYLRARPLSAAETVKAVARTRAAARSGSLSVSLRTRTVGFNIHCIARSSVL